MRTVSTTYYLVLRFAIVILFGSLPVLMYAQQNDVSSDSINQLNQLSRELLERTPDSALRYSEQALQAAESANFKRGMAEAMTNLGFYYLDRADYTISFDYFQKVYSIQESIGDTLGMMEGLRNLGAVYRQRKLYEGAKEYFEKALKLAEARNNTGMLATINKDLGGVFYYEKNYQLALKYFKNSLTYIPKNEKSLTYAAVLNNIGVVYKAWKRYEQALQYLEDSYEILVTSERLTDLSANLMNIGEVYEALGEKDKAEGFYYRALDNAKKVNNVQRLAEVYQYLANFYAGIEQYDEAFNYQKLHSQLKDTLYNAEVDAQMAEIAKKLEVERNERAFSNLIQDKELEILNQSNEINKLKVYRLNILILLVVIALGVIVVGSLILYKNYQNKNKQNTKLTDQNSLLQQMNYKLQQSEQKFKELNDTKDKFFGILAHDLRSPLATLRGFVQVLNLDYNKLSVEEINRLTGQIERSLQSLTNLLDNLLQWATSQTGIIEFDPKSQSLYQVVEETHELLEAIAASKEIMLENSVKPGLSTYADQQMIRLIMRNLLSNAIKFTPAGGKIVVSASESEAYTSISIADNGIGMNKTTLESIRNAGRAKSNRGTNNEKGSGLGLILCFDFVKKHGGKITVDSTINQGTTFNVILPKQHQSQPLEAAV